MSIALSNRRTVGTCGAVALLATSVAGAQQQQYSVTNLGTLPAEYNLASEAWDINNAGQVVGESFRKITLPTASDGFLWTPTTPNGTTGTMVRITPTGGGGTGINATGQIAGLDDPSVAPNYAHLWAPSTPNGTSGTSTPLPSLPNRPVNIAFGINDAGQVVGYAANYSQSPQPERAYLWKPSTPNGTSGTIVDLGELPGGEDVSYAYAINSVGQVAGRSVGTNGERAFLWQPTTPNATTGTLTDLGVAAGFLYSEASNINDTGHVVGASYNTLRSPRDGRAVLWTPATPNGSTGSFTDLGDLPGGDNLSYAIDINEGNTIVGYGYGADGRRATVWLGGAAGAIDLNTLTDASGAFWTLEIARGINDYGQVVGYGQFDPDGDGPEPAAKRAFLLTPVPEPANLALLSLAGAALLRRRRQRSHRSVDHASRVAKLPQ